MLIYSMSVWVGDGLIADREGAFGVDGPYRGSRFRFHIALVSELGGYLCGRRLYETMLVWETDPSLRDNEPRGPRSPTSGARFRRSLFSRTLDSVQGNARLAEASLTEEIAAALDATDKDVSIGGAGLAAAAFELGLVDELRMFRYPVVVGGGTPFLPPVTEDVPLDLIETRTFGSPGITSATGASAMSRTDTAVRVISAAPDRVFAAPDLLRRACGVATAGRMIGRFEHLDARSGGSYRLALDRIPPPQRRKEGFSCPSIANVRWWVRLR